jgi:hypothetical protein
MKEFEVQRMFRETLGVDLRRSYFPNLLRMDEATTRQFQSQVQESGGTIRIAVHPYFNRLDMMNQSVSKYLQNWERLLAADSGKKVPLVVLECGGGSYKGTQELIKKATPEHQQKKIYFVPTYEADPTPMWNYRGESKPNDDPDVEERAWEKLVGLLKKSGIKKVIIGGQYLKVVKGKAVWDNGFFERQLLAKGNNFLQNYTLSNCVGGAVVNLSKDFEIEVSNIAFPHRRSIALGMIKS